MRLSGDSRVKGCCASLSRCGSQYPLALVLARLQVSNHEMSHVLGQAAAREPAGARTISLRLGIREACLYPFDIRGAEVGLPAVDESSTAACRAARRCVSRCTSQMTRGQSLHDVTARDAPSWNSGGGAGCKHSVGTHCFRRASNPGLLGWSKCCPWPALQIGRVLHDVPHRDRLAVGAAILKSRYWLMSASRSICPAPRVAWTAVQVNMLGD